MYKFIYNRIVSNSGERFSERALFLFFSFVRKLILKTGDRNINYKIWGFDFRIPFSYNLPIIIKNHRNYNTNLLRISKYLNRKYSDLKLIDVGANVGDTVGLIKSELDIPILSIEGDEKFYKLLMENCKPFNNVYSEKIFLSDSTSKIGGKLTSNLGTGSIISSDVDTITTSTLDELLVKNILFSNAKIIKIDTDGFDYKIIRGSTKYISSSMPAIFIEYDPVFHKIYKEESLFIFTFLEELGYSKVVFYDNMGDYLVSVNVSDLEKINELTLYFTGRNHLLYCDLCFFHKEDEDIFAIAQKEEQEFFLKNR